MKLPTNEKETTYLVHKYYETMEFLNVETQLMAPISQQHKRIYIRKGIISIVFLMYF